MAGELIFIADEEAHIVELIKLNLETVGYKVLTFKTGEDLLEECKKSVPDLIILDILLSGIDGFEVCRQLRQNLFTKITPLIFLSSKKEEFDKVLGLEIGADDYITKPFSIRELQSRIKALLRRVNISFSEESEPIKFKDILMDSVNREVYKGGRSLKL